MVGYGHVYQSRYKSFPVESEEYFYQVMRYVERNALRSNLVAKAEQWQYGSLWINQFGTVKHNAMLSKWPLPRPRQVGCLCQRASERRRTGSTPAQLRPGVSLWQRRMGSKDGKETWLGINTETTR